MHADALAGGVSLTLPGAPKAVPVACGSATALMPVQQTSGDGCSVG